MQIQSDDLCAWLRLLATPGVGRRTARVLLAQFGPPTAIFEQHRQALLGVVGVDVAIALGTEPDGLGTHIAETQAWLAADDARDLIALDDARYPRALLDTADPPLALYVHGLTALLNAPSLAIVGSRNTTAQGSDNARAFAKSLSERGYTVVSGLALGIDAAAHEGALTGRGSTIAVVGTGLDRIYPARHNAMARDIAQRGLLLSEFPIGTPPLRENFPQRNRIIAGLAQGTLVVEAALGSGSLITARFALECGREVFAIPGSIHSPQSRGCHALIKQGAKLVEDAQDIVSELERSFGNAVGQTSVGAPTMATTASLGGGGDGGSTPREASVPTTRHTVLPRDAALLDAMGFDPISLDTLIDRTGFDTATAQARLLDLELDGAVQRLPGGRFQRRSHA